jgi:mitosis inhibitor protein kinase SWE1
MGPEVLNGHIDKPADIFSLGIITLEMAGNIFIPDNGDLWQNLRNGNLRNIPTLTWSTDSALERDADGVAINHPAVIALANAPPVPPMPGMPPVRRRPSRPRVPELPTPPQFMSEAGHPGSLDNLVHWMLSPDPNDRPTVDQLIQCPTLRWIAHRLRDAATIYEGNWGPALTGKENDPIPALGPFGPRMIPNEIENYPLPDMPPPGKYPTDEEFDRENIEDYDDRNKNGGDDIEMSGVD